jgi:hypothetical protein
MNEISWPPEFEELSQVLIGAGLRVVLSEMPTPPGNAVVELAGPGLAVRLDRERGQWAIRLRRPQDRWQGVDWWRDQVAPDAHARLETLSQQVAFVEQHLPELMGDVGIAETAMSDSAKQRASYLADRSGVARPPWTSAPNAYPPSSVPPKRDQTEEIALPSDLERLFPILVQAGFRVVREQRFESFGNAMVELAGPVWNVRFVRDRDYWDIEVRRLRSDWHGLPWWQRNVVHDDGPDLSGIQAKVAFVERHLPELRGDRRMRDTVDDPAAVARRNAASLGARPPSWATEPGGRPPSPPWRVRWWRFLSRLRGDRRN